MGLTYEMRKALTDLDQRTPEFYRREIFSHGTLDARRKALSILGSLGSDPLAGKVMRAVIDITNTDDHRAY